MRGAGAEVVVVDDDDDVAVDVGDQC